MTEHKDPWFQVQLISRVKSMQKSHLAILKAELAYNQKNGIVNEGLPSYIKNVEAMIVELEEGDKHWSEVAKNWA